MTFSAPTGTGHAPCSCPDQSLEASNARPLGHAGSGCVCAVDARLERVLAEDLTHYNDHRPHRSLAQQAPRALKVAPASIDKPDPTQLRRAAVLGGIIREYRLVA